MHVHRYVPNLSASEYEANLQVISTTGSVQVYREQVGECCQLI